MRNIKRYGLMGNMEDAHYVMYALAAARRAGLAPEGHLASRQLPSANIDTTATTLGKGERSSPPDQAVAKQQGNFRNEGGGDTRGGADDNVKMSGPSKGNHLPDIEDDANDEVITLSGAPETDRKSGRQPYYQTLVSLKRKNNMKNGRRLSIESARSLIAFIQFRLNISIAWHILKRPVFPPLTHIRTALWYDRSYLQNTILEQRSSDLSNVSVATYEVVWPSSPLPCRRPT